MKMSELIPQSRSETLSVRPLLSSSQLNSAKRVKEVRAEAINEFQKVQAGWKLTNTDLLQARVIQAHLLYRLLMESLEFLANLSANL